MTKQEFKEKFKAVEMEAFNIFFSNAPVKTGNLRNMITLNEIPDGFIIVSNADYTEFTEEKGKHAEWFKKSMEEAFNYIVREMTT